ncbi:hypothetical protein ACFL20_10175 [Spirochaetota bacterium]
MKIVLYLAIIISLILSSSLLAKDSKKNYNNVSPKDSSMFMLYR